MDVEILDRGAFAAALVKLESGESFVSESGALYRASSNVDVDVTTKTRGRGGILAGVKRLLASEHFFFSTYRTTVRTAAPPEKGLNRERGAYLASEEGVRCDAKWQGFRGLLNEGLFVLRATGTGLLFFHAYGAIHEVPVDGEYTVDNGYAVAWEPTLEYRLTRSRRVRAFLFSDQLLLRFRGRGRVWVQTRSANMLANWVHPFRPVKSSDN